MKSILANKRSPLKEMIKEHIKMYFHTYITPDLKISDFFYLLVYYIRILAVLFRSSSSSNSTIGLIVAPSHSVKLNWMLLYFASLLAGKTLIIIPSNVTETELKNIIISNTIMYIFTDDFIANKLNLKDLPKYYSSVFLRHLVRGIFNLYTLDVIYSTNEQVSLEYNTAVDTANPPVGINEIDEVFEKFCNNKPTSKLVNYTKGTQSFEKRSVVNDESVLVDHLNRLKKSRFWKEYMEVQTTVFSMIPYEYSHILTVLVPFFKNSVFVDDIEKAEVVIEDTKSFEQVWEEKVDSIMEGKFRNSIFRHKEFQWLFKRLASRNLKRYYNKRTRKEAVIVYNSQIHTKALDLAKDVLPLITTYGTQETIQIVAFNDFSNDSLNSFMCAGELLPNIDVYPDEGVLHLFGTNNMTVSAITEDVMQMRDNYLFVFGRIYNRISSVFKVPVQLDILEKLVKSFPYVSECQVYLEIGEGLNQTLTFVVEPNIKFVLSLNIGLLKLQKILKYQIRLLLSELSVYVSDSKIEVIILSKPFVKAIDGLPYQPLTRKLKFY